MLSVIIPSRNTPEFPLLQKSVDDLFDNARGEVEVIIVLDGFWPNPPLKERPNQIIIHNAEPKGMRHGINSGARIARGKYIMKCDDHCAFGIGYDIALTVECDDDWLVVPSRYALDGTVWLAGPDPSKPVSEGWMWKFSKGRPYGPIDYLYMTYPFTLDNQFGFGFHGKKWTGEFGLGRGYFHREEKLKHIPIDDILSFQGSCWFMPKALYERIGGMQQEGYFDHQEAQELGFKVWLSGGRCVVNKKTWYAHLHKGDLWGRGYRLLKHKMINSQIYSCDIWMNNKWEGQTRPLKYLIDKFWPLEQWPQDWDNPKRWESYNYDMWHKANEIQKQLGKDFIHADELKGVMNK